MRATSLVPRPRPQTARTWERGYIGSMNVTSFPVYCLVCVDHDTWKRKSSEQQGRPGSIHHVMSGGRGGVGPNCKICLDTDRVELYRASGVLTSHDTLKLSRLDDELILDLLNRVCPTSTSHPLDIIHVTNAPRPSPLFATLMLPLPCITVGANLRTKNGVG